MWIHQHAEPDDELIQAAGERPIAPIRADRSGKVRFSIGFGSGVGGFSDPASR